MRHSVMISAGTIRDSTPSTLAANAASPLGRAAGFAHGVQRSGADVAEKDADGGNRKCESAPFCRVAAAAIHLSRQLDRQYKCRQMTRYRARPLTAVRVIGYDRR